MIETSESFLARMLILAFNDKGPPTGSDAVRLQDLANGHYQVGGVPDDFSPPTSTELESKQ